MEAEIGYSTERLDHLGIVAGVCREIGLAEWLDSQAGESERYCQRHKLTFTRCRAYHKTTRPTSSRRTTAW